MTLLAPIQMEHKILTSVKDFPVFVISGSLTARMSYNLKASVRNMVKNVWQIPHWTNFGLLTAINLKLLRQVKM
ncbi:hypothetical protein D3C81_1813790 [compost metagenome]